MVCLTQLINFIWAITYFNYNKRLRWGLRADALTKGSKELFLTDFSNKCSYWILCMNICYSFSFSKEKKKQKNNNKQPSLSDTYISKVYRLHFKNTGYELNVYFCFEIFLSFPLRLYTDATHTCTHTCILTSLYFENSYQ